MQKRIPLEWTALRDVVAIADAGSLLAAARELGITQPTLGRRLEQLEKRLAAQLFNRSPRGLTPTAMGEQVLLHARQMAEDAAAIERLATGANETLKGSVRLTSADHICTAWLPKRLPLFAETFPELALELVADNRELNLSRREADLAIRHARPKQADLVARRVGDMRYGFYASSEYLDTFGRPSSLRAFRKHYFVGYDETIYRNRMLDRLERAVGIERIRYRANTVLAATAAVEAGTGIGILACYIADERPALERLLVDEQTYRFQLWVVTHADLYRVSRIRAVFSFLADQFEADADRL